MQHALKNRRNCDLQYKANQSRAQNQMVLDFLSDYKNELVLNTLLHHLRYDINPRLLLTVKRTQIDYSLQYQCRLTKICYLVTGTMKAVATMESHYANVSADNLFGDKNIRVKQYWTNEFTPLCFGEMVIKLTDLCDEQNCLKKADIA